MRINELLAKLEGVRRAGDGRWSARCPAHGDSDPSLSVRECEDGRILLHCHAGCASDAVCAALGITLRDLMPPDDGIRSGRRERDRGQASGPSARRERDTHVCDYDYQGPDGRVVFRVSRFVRPDGSKTFKQLRPDPAGRGGWSFGLAGGGVARVPYRLPKVIEAAAEHRTIVIVEGEKDTLTAEGMGLTATCNPGGALKWSLMADGWYGYFAGAGAIVIVADNDPETKRDERTGEMRPHWRGQRHAWDVRQRIVAAGYRGRLVTMVMPPVDGQPVKDLTEWADARRARGMTVDVEAFREAVGEAPEWPKQWRFTGSEKLDRPPSTPASGDSNVVRFEAAGRMYSIDPRGNLAEEIDKCIASARGEDDGDATGGQKRRLSGREAMEIRSEAAVAWLRSNGRFYYHADPDKRGLQTDMYYDSRRRKLWRIEDEAYQCMLSYTSGVNRSTSEWRHLIARVHDEVMASDHGSPVLPAKYFARRCGKTYVSCGDGVMARIGPGTVEMVDNGTDGVLFTASRTLAPWRLLDGPGRDPFAACEVFSSATYSSQHGIDLARVWLLGAVCGIDAKPPLLLSGAAGGGKTAYVNGIYELLGMRRQMTVIQSGDRGQEAFCIALDLGGIVCIDNLDDDVKWFPNAAEGMSTGTSMMMRRMYSQEMIDFKPDASLVITSVEGRFGSSVALTDRLVIVRLDRADRRKNGDMADLLEQVRGVRDECMTWICRVIASATAQEASEIPDAINRRYPGWASYGARFGRVIGREAEVIDAMREAEHDKAIYNLQHDWLGSILLAIIEDGEVWTGTISDLVDTICQRAGLNEREQSNLSAVRIGKRIHAMWSHLVEVMSAERRIVSGYPTYTLHGNVVRMVRMDDENQESHTPAHAHVRGHACESHDMCATSSPSSPLESDDIGIGEI